jgi:hypothetical protein
LANSLRGNASMSDAILTVHRALMSHPSGTLDEINTQVTQAAFRVPTHGFESALGITNHNLNQIEKLSRNVSPGVALNYLKLTAAYIVENPDRVNAWIELDAEASAAAFAKDGEAIKALLLALAPVDQQSLASMKLYAALHSFSDDMIREYLNRNLTSHWTQNRLLYPLIYYFINLPDPHALDQLLAHVFPSRGTGPAERILTRLLLQPDRPENGNLAVRCYVALLSHPYDALEYIVTDLERRCADGSAIDLDYLRQYERIAAAFPKHRVAQLVALAHRTPLGFAHRPTCLNGIALLPGSPEHEALLTVMDARCTEAPDFVLANPLIRAIVSIRWTQYPIPQHFDELYSYHRRFAMLASARLVRYIATSLFMFERLEPHQERLTLLGGVLLTDTLSPFAISGPQGFLMASGARLPCEKRPSEIIEETSEALGENDNARLDRMWIKGANWLLMDDQVAGRMRAWIAAARAKFPVWVQPRYLSGLDWHWLSGVIDSLGMRSLIGNVDMIYVLFLKQLEEFRRESVPLRVAIEPIVRRCRSSEEFSDWLHEHLGEDSSAFVRFFMTADTILKLRLTDNYMAALSCRLELLERAVRQFDFKPGVFSEDDYKREQDALTAMLGRMSVGARQFEISWSMLADNAVERNRDAYSAFETVSQAMPEDSVANTRLTSPYQYSNGATGDYESRNRDWPMVLLIAGVIDTFLTQPTTGIEAILSVRIRHDALRREFEAAMNQVESGRVAGVSPRQVKRISGEISPGIYREIQRWIDTRVHTKRKDKPQALFDFIPTKAEMTELLQAAIGRELRDIIELVFDWIKPRLETQLATARKSLADDLGAALQQRVQVSRVDLSKARDNEDIKRVADAIAASLARRTGDLEEWFMVPDGKRDRSLSVEEVMNAVRQRFRLDHARGRLMWSALPPTVAERVVAPRHIRHLYDLLSEIVHNARKHAGQERTLIRMSRLGGRGTDAVVISNRKASSETRVEQIEGHPYRTLHETLFGENNSGLKKIAYIVASIVSTPIVIEVRETSDYFHLIIPVAVLGEGVGQ